MTPLSTEFVWSNEIAKAAITLVIVVVVGGAVGVFYEKAKHRHQLSLEAQRRFYDVYGKWFATWKEWEVKPTPSGLERSRLLIQASEVEGEFESMLVRIATEQRLSDGEIRRLARFREGYQQLRESIERNRPLPFKVQATVADPMHLTTAETWLVGQVKAYLTFKSLSVEFAALLQARRRGGPLRRMHVRPSLRRSQETFVRVTSWRMKSGNKNLWWSDRGNDSIDKAVLTLHTLRYAAPRRHRTRRVIRRTQARLRWDLRRLRHWVNQRG